MLNLQKEELAPHSEEAEEAVIGSVLINPDAFFEVSAFLTSGDFFVVRCGWIWDAITAVEARGDAIDNLTVIAELRSIGRLEQVGGSGYIAQLMNNTPTHIHAETYARIIERAAIRRRLLNAASNIAQSAMQENSEIENVVDRAEHAIYSVTAQTRRDMPTLRSLTSEVWQSVEMMYTAKAQTLGIPTGFDEIDSVMSGLEKSRLYIVAARPGSGKTSLLLCIAANVVKNFKLPVGIFSLEMNADQLARRLISIESHINSHKLRIGNLEPNEWAKFTEATGRVSNWPIHIDATSGITIPQMRARMRLWQREHGLSLVVVDYLQLAHAAGRHGSREGEVSEIARGLKELAREFNVPIFAAAQLNRQLENRQDKRPILADLRESGEIENAADAVMFIYRDEMYNEWTDDKGKAEIIFGKQRDGQTGKVSLGWRAHTTEFYNLPSKKV